MSKNTTEIETGKFIEESIIMPVDIIDDYKTLKLEFWSYLEGLTKGSWNSKDKVRNFFRHLEYMIFGREVSINDLSKL